jgi:hypothetical protein
VEGKLIMEVGVFKFFINSANGRCIKKFWPVRWNLVGVKAVGSRESIAEDNIKQMPY